MSGAEAASGGSAGLSILGGFVAADAARSGAENQAQGILASSRAKADAEFFNAGQYEYQALIDERNRGIALEQMWSDIHDQTKKNIAQFGQIRAAYGASGLSLEGSPLDVLEATAVEQSLDVEKTLYTGEVVAAGLTDQAAQARAQASLLRYSASNTLTAGNMGAASARSAGAYQSAAAIISGFAGAAKSFTVPTGKA